MLFTTTTAVNNTIVKYAILKVFRAILNEFELGSNTRIKIFLAKTKISPTTTVTVNFTITKPDRLELTNPARNGFNS